MQRLEAARWLVPMSVRKDGRYLPLHVGAEVEHCGAILRNHLSTKLARYPTSLEKECGLNHTHDAHALLGPSHHF